MEHPLVPDYILRKLILLYGFTKETHQMTKKEINPLCTPTFEKYFIINGDWLNKYKDFYCYDQIVKIIQSNKYNFPNYFTFKTNIGKILSNIKQYKLRQKELLFPVELSQGISFAPKIGEFFSNNLDIHDAFYIVNQELIELLSQDKENPSKPNYSFISKINLNGFLNKYSYFIYVKNIEICTMNKEGMFAHQYCIKLEEGDPVKEIGKIINNGGIETIVEEKELDNKSSTQYDNQGGLIFNIEKIRNNREEKQKKNHIIL